jgi:hypothetical protein
MESAHQPELWQNLYVVLGSSSAALIGLLFIATSLHLDEIISNPILRTRAYHNMGYLLIAFVNAVLILIPQSMLMLGTELAAVNLFGMGIHLRIANEFLRNQKDYARGGGRFGRWIIFFVGFLLGLVGSGAVLIGHLYWGIYLVTASCLVLLVMTVLNAWSIMVGVVGQLERTTKTKRATTRHFR